MSSPPFTALTPEFEYADECLQHLMQRETRRQPFHSRSPQLEFRKDLIQRIQVLCVCLKLSTRVKYLSVYILDYFMDNHVINEDVLELIVMCSLAIAVKVEECDRTLKYSHMFSDANQYSAEEVLSMEAMILRFFDWLFLTPTAATYMDYFCAKCLPQLYAKKSVKFLVDKYLDKSLDLRFYSFSPSVIAASTVYYTRDKLNLEPVWGKDMQNITTYSTAQLKDCVHELKKFDFLTKPSKRITCLHKELDDNDSGYGDLETISP